MAEILSPSTIQTDRRTKLQLYARHGLPHYWIVDPDVRSIEAYEPTEGAYRVTTRAAGDEPFSVPPFDDLTITAATLWP